MDNDNEPLCEADLLEEMIMALVDHPDKVWVDSVDRGKTTDLVIHTDPSDCGKVIGKSGRTVDTIRIFFGVIASRAGRHFSIKIADEINQRSNVQWVANRASVMR